MRYWDWFGDGRLAVTHAALACCVVEFESATLGRPCLERVPDGARVAVVIDGTVTDALAPAVVELVAASGTDPIVIAFGACSCGGGPYWDSPVVTNGVDTLVDVDPYIAGCPPPPGSLASVLDSYA